MFSLLFKRNNYFLKKRNVLLKTSYSSLQNVNIINKNKLNANISIRLLSSYEGMSEIDIEKELHKIKRRMGSYFSKGDYNNALSCAIELEDQVIETHGKDHVVYASCLNNTALMQKMLGFNDAAMDKYTTALHIYEDRVGKKHKSYVSTLANLGVLYKVIAESSTGIDKLQLLERSEEALLDSIKIRIEISSVDNKDVLITSNHLASLWRISKREDKAEEKLREILIIARKKYGDNDSITATTLNNLGVLLKSQNRYKDALPIYEEALDIRSKTLGDTHPNTIISMHNLAELLISSGKDSDATKLQEKILEIMESQSNNPKISKSIDTNKIENKIGDKLGNKIEMNKSNETKVANIVPPVTFDNRNKILDPFLNKSIEEKRKIQMDAINSTKSNQIPSSRKKRK